MSLNRDEITSGRAERQAAPPTYRLIQALRAVAALMVVVHHATQALHERYHLSTPEWPNGAAGVDIFFVISGFVMTVSSQRLVATAHPTRTFITRRLERIVPLYWLLTAGKVLLVKLRPTATLNGLGSTWHVVSSFLFLPSLRNSIPLEPVLVVGWTLNLEMFFYGVFALALWFRFRVQIFVVSVLLLLSLVSLLPVDRSSAFWPVLLYYCDPLVLEFSFGVLLASGLHWVKKLPWPVATACLMAGFTCLFLWDWPRVSSWRFAGWGVPALAIVGGAIALDEKLGKRTSRWLLELGDSSYSLYLAHAFALPLLSMGTLLWVAHARGGYLLSVLLLVVLSVLFGEGLYRLVELPIMRYFKGRRRTAIPANV